MTMNRRHFASLLLALPLGVLPARADAKFEAFIENSLWPRAKKAGIPAFTLRCGFRGHHRA
jgi:hypothetical protein